MRGAASFPLPSSVYVCVRVGLCVKVFVRVVSTVVKNCIYSTLPYETALLLATFGIGDSNTYAGCDFSSPSLKYLLCVPLCTCVWMCECLCV